MRGLVRMKTLSLIGVGGVADKHLHAWPGQDEDPVIDWCRWCCCSMAGCWLGLLVVLTIFIMLLVFLGQVEAHGLVLVITQACLLGDVVEDDYWPCHFYFFLVLVPS